MTSTVNLREDLQTRWVPGEAQTERANALLAAHHYDGVYTLHLLLDKEYGIWTEDVEIVALDGVFVDRATALECLSALAAAYHKATGRKVTGGYTIHGPEGRWAVFEDILAQFPKGR